MTCPIRSWSLNREAVTVEALSSHPLATAVVEVVVPCVAGAYDAATGGTAGLLEVRAPSVTT